MNSDDFSGHVSRVLGDIEDMTRKGQKEYARIENVFQNFESVAKEIDSEREKVLWTYAMKHKDGIAAYLRGHVSQREPVTGRILDLIVYLVILWAMVEQNENAIDDS